mmetsp:Transcript_105515/g.339867  ORF Transcript_105515/g.339867 Transcript_105515/m.339867 type:complete len:246 (+) Transcript_105515:25-762(+)
MHQTSLPVVPLFARLCSLPVALPFKSDSATMFQQDMQLESEKTLQLHRLQQQRRDQQMLWLLSKPGSLLRSHHSLRQARQRYSLSSEVTLTAGVNAEIAIGPMIAAGSSLHFWIHVPDCDEGELSLNLAVRQIGDNWYETGGGICIWGPRSLCVRSDTRLHSEESLHQARSMLAPAAASLLHRGGWAEVYIDLAARRLRCGEEEVALTPGDGGAALGDAVPTLEIGTLSAAKAATLRFEWAAPAA